MTDGERQMQPLNSDGTETPLCNAASCSNSESTSPSSPGGNGYVWEMGCTSPSSVVASSAEAPSSSLAVHPTKSAFTNNASPSGVVPEVIKLTEEPSSPESKRDDTMKSTSSEASSDTFYTPSASLQNISVSKMSDKNRRLSDFLDDQKQKGAHLYEENDESEAESGTTSTTTIPVIVAETPDNPPNDEENSVETEEVQLSHQEAQAANSESRQQQTNKHIKKVQQHKRQNSAGSQCSLSSNPENSQFKTADAHSSDSDASRNSASASGIFESCSPSKRLGDGSYHEYMKDDPDGKSLQSDHSHSGEQLNTSVESVEFGGSGELAVRRRSDAHTPTSGHSISIGISGSSSVSPPQGSHVSSSGEKPRVKKKMWYQQIFSTSYKTRSGDFKKIFKDLPPKERLIVDYSCALQKDILLQGRMYVSQNYVSFYANIFGWETQTSISFKEIESVTKEKTALIIPNAIGITTMTEKFFFSSFVTRDTTYVMLFKLWQAALLDDVSVDDNLSKKELWQLVHTCYGEELGVTSEDESEEMFCPPLVATSTVSTLITTTEVDGINSINNYPEVSTKPP